MAERVFSIMEATEEVMVNIIVHGNAHYSKPAQRTGDGRKMISLAGDHILVNEIADTFGLKRKD
jgi:hypothetical protein